MKQNKNETERNETERIQMEIASIRNGMELNGQNLLETKGNETESYKIL